MYTLFIFLVLCAYQFTHSYIIIVNVYNIKYNILCMIVYKHTINTSRLHRNIHYFSYRYLKQKSLIMMIVQYNDLLNKLHLMYTHDANTNHNEKNIELKKQKNCGY